jgi:hypothetical protein
MNTEKNFPELFHSSFSSKMNRIDSPARNMVPYLYDSDKKRFAEIKGCTMFFRRLSQGEFPQYDWIPNRPDIYVRVLQHEIGLHEITVVWVGSHDFDLSVTSKTEVMSIVQEMDRRGGVDPAYCREFKQRFSEFLEGVRSRRMNEVNS